MAVAATKITAAPDVVMGNQRVHTRRLTFSGNYATGGEAITASTFGLRRATRIIIHQGVAAAADVATGNPVGYNSATGKVVFYESGASGAAEAEKTNAEAYPTGSFVDATAYGFR